MAIGEPVWELARAFPAQGTWSEADYLEFNCEGVHIELTDGMIEVLPVPTHKHQTLLSFLHVLLRGWAKGRGGFAVPAGIRVRVGPGKFREPDVAVLLALEKGAYREHGRFGRGATAQCAMDAALSVDVSALFDEE